MNEKIMQIKEIIFSGGTDQEIREQLKNYHDNDIANAIQQLDEQTRFRLYRILGVEQVSEIFAYMDDASDYLEELPLEQAADVLENMDVDDAVDVLEQIESEERKEDLLSHMEESASNAVRLIHSYSEEEIGSQMTTNFVKVFRGNTVKEAMKSLISQAKDNDNISTIYVEEADGAYYGAIDLRDLIIAREYDSLEDVISTNYPVLQATQEISDVIEKLKDYAEDSFPVLDEDNRLIGIITSQDIVEAVDEELGEDYAKLAGLTDQEESDEKVFESMKKRLPWLGLLFFLGLGVSSVVGMFESLVSQIAVIICFQSLILDMAGNVGTQSLAVTIRVLVDEAVDGKAKAKLVLKELRVGGVNGLLLGGLTFAFVGVYLNILKGYAWSQAFEIAGCVGLALFLAMLISSLIGTIVPIFFHKIHIDPAVASGPLITTVNDLVAVVSYYGLAMLFLVGRI